MDKAGRLVHATPFFVACLQFATRARAMGDGLCPRSASAGVLSRVDGIYSSRVLRNVEGRFGLGTVREARGAQHDIDDEGDRGVGYLIAYH